MLRAQGLANAAPLGKPGGIISSLGTGGFIFSLTDSALNAWEKLLSDVYLSSYGVFLRSELGSLVLFMGSGGKQKNWDVKCQLLFFLSMSRWKWWRMAQERSWGGWGVMGGPGGRWAEAKSGRFIKRSVKSSRADGFYRQNWGKLPLGPPALSEMFSEHGRSESCGEARGQWGQTMVLFSLPLTPLLG